MADKMDFNVTRIKPGEDLSRVFKIRNEILGYGEDDLDEIGISIILSEVDGSEARDIACGRILLDMESDRLIIEQIGVIESERGKGLGSRVVNELMSIAKETDASEVWAKTHSNDAAISLLEKHGFEELNRYWMNVDVEYFIK